MIILYTIIALLFLAYFTVLLLCLRGILLPDQKRAHEKKEMPFVSVLLAARNEEELILRNLKALSELNYPKDKLEILIGDDDSEDNTVELVLSFIDDQPNMQLYRITEKLGKAKGKANVLAHLAHKAHGEFYFITDVDVALPAEWIRDLLDRMDERTGIVSGTTLCDQGTFFAEMQRIDWMHFMGYIKAMANLGIACTSVGNNMAVRAEAYWETGGYEHMRFSITEDYRLFEQVTLRGWGWANVLSPGSTGKAWYIPNLFDFLNQRKRWLQGARDLPLNWKAMLVVFGSYIPMWWVLLLIAPLWSIPIGVVKFFIQGCFIRKCFYKTGSTMPQWGNLLVYELYLHLMVVASAVFYLLPIATRWKGRIYKSNID